MLYNRIVHVVLHFKVQRRFPNFKGYILFILMFVTLLHILAFSNATLAIPLKFTFSLKVMDLSHLTGGFAVASERDVFWRGVSTSRKARFW